MLQAIKSAGLSFQPTKCRFADGELNFLGNVVSNKGVRANPERMWAVAAFTPPSDKKAVRRFFGHWLLQAVHLRVR